MNYGLLQSLMTSYGYLLHSFYPPENRGVFDFYDRTSEWEA